jgi:hypothetical protein
MPDLLTHYAAARVPGAFLPDARVRTLFILGTFIPDVVAKSTYLLLGAHIEFGVPSHSLLGMALLCYAACLFVEPALRARAFAALYAGSVLHVAVDLLKDGLGAGSAALFHPFLLHRFELGWLDPEDVALFFPIDAGLLILAIVLERRLRAVRKEAHVR